MTFPRQVCSGLTMVAIVLGMTSVYAEDIPNDLKSLLPESLFDEYHSQLEEKFKDLRTNFRYVVRSNSVEFFPNDSFRCSDNQGDEETLMELTLSEVISSDRHRKATSLSMYLCGQLLARENVTVFGNQLGPMDVKERMEWLKNGAQWKIESGAIKTVYRLDGMSKTLLLIETDLGECTKLTQFGNGERTLFLIQENDISEDTRIAFEPGTFSGDNIRYFARIKNHPKISFPEVAYSVEGDDFPQRSFRDWKAALGHAILEPLFDDVFKSTLKDEVIAGLPRTERVVSLARSQKFIDDLSFILQLLRNGDPTQVGVAKNKLIEIMNGIQKGQISIDDHRE